MTPASQSHLAFFLTGRRIEGELDGIEGRGLRPALMATFGDLTRLRHDFPLLLLDDPDDGVFIKPLSAVIDAVIANLGDEPDADRLRKQALLAEDEIRRHVAGIGRETLETAWKAASAALAPGHADIAAAMTRLGALLPRDATLISCGGETTRRCLLHLWAHGERMRARAFAARLATLTQKLSDILQSSFARSDRAHSGENLRAAFGSGRLDDFDFDAMSELLVHAAPQTGLPKARQRRIEHLISQLKRQRFWATGGTEEQDAAKPYDFVFESCEDALKAYRDRLPDAIELARTIAIAELEVAGDYSDAKHDVIFQFFGENGLDAASQEALPYYLVCLSGGALASSKVIETLSIGLPIKILVQSDDVLERSPADPRHVAFGLGGSRFACMAMNLNDVFVMQSTASHLPRMLGDVANGLRIAGPSLFHVYSGMAGTAFAMQPYLAAAAAVETRLFPLFVYDPSAGPDWASRFGLGANPQCDKAWPSYEIAYEDERQQKVVEIVSLTFADFVAMDPRYSGQFALVPPRKWDGTPEMVAIAAARPDSPMPDTVPGLWMVDREHRLQQVLIDQRLLHETRRCQALWYSLQELAGIHNSHAARQLAEARGNEPTVTAPLAEEAAETKAEIVAEAEPAVQPDAPYIETARCSTCNECIQINDKMFAYNENRQAYVKDATAGTYAQLVQAAENCQVSVIHPGKPLNPNEPGLEELKARAEAFL